MASIDESVANTIAKILSEIDNFENKVKIWIYFLINKSIYNNISWKYFILSFSFATTTKQ